MKITPTQQRVIDTICELFNLTHAEMFSKSRKGSQPIARYFFMKWLRENNKYSLPKIGDYFPKGYDHTTVIHGIKVADDMISVYEEYRRIWDEIKTIFVHDANPFTALKYRPHANAI